jgi:putative ABC transport system ATP-binding protein
VTSGPFILCEKLVKIYQIEGLEVLALQGLDLAVQRGEMLGIVGASGSGKTTLMNILGGLDRPTSGKVWVGGMNLLGMRGRDLTLYRKRQVGFVWQQGARNLIPFLSALENIELPMALAGVPSKTAHHRAGELLETIGLGNRAKFQLAQLSGGEQQRVAIAVALANQPGLLLADEPTGELDTNTAISIYQVFQALNQKFNVTILIVSHAPAIAKYMHRVVAIHDGQITSETVRHLASSAETSARQTEGQPLEELVVVDEKGWLHVPEAYLQKCHIKDRARLEITPEGILIRSVPGYVAAADVKNEAKRLALEDNREASKGLRRFLPRRRPRSGWRG